MVTLVVIVSQRDATNSLVLSHVVFNHILKSMLKSASAVERDPRNRHHTAMLA
jgi:hypothetical protein